MGDGEALDGDDDLLEDEDCLSDYEYELDDDEDDDGGMSFAEDAFAAEEGNRATSADAGDRQLAAASGAARTLIKELRSLSKVTPPVYALVC